MSGYYLKRRLLYSLLTLLGASLIAFFVVRLVPGDPVTALLGPRYNEAQALLLQKEWGLDRPLYEQYFVWLKNALSGNFGLSHFTGQPVLTSILTHLPVTLELSALATLFALVLGLPLGILAATGRSKLSATLATFFGLSGVSIPNFYLATLLILAFALHLGLFPSIGFTPIHLGLGRHLLSMVLPAVALGMAVMGIVLKMTTQTLREEIHKDYMVTARAKGLGRGRTVWKHALKNAILPVITLCGIQAGYLLGGSVVLEQMFALPGLGSLTFEAITNRDYALLQGALIFVALVFVGMNWLVDLLYLLLNPRMKH